jgi:hypothetical protein
MTLRGSTIGIAGFIAVLVAWPIVLYVAGNHSPDAVPALTVAAFVFIIGGAIVLRSWAIAGTLMDSVSASCCTMRRSSSC